MYLTKSSPDNTRGRCQMWLALLWNCCARMMTTGEFVITSPPQDLGRTLEFSGCGSFFLSVRSDMHPHLHSRHWEAQQNQALLSAASEGQLRFWLGPNDRFEPWPCRGLSLWFECNKTRDSISKMSESHLSLVDNGCVKLQYSMPFIRACQVHDIHEQISGSVAHFDRRDVRSANDIQFPALNSLRSRPSNFMGVSNMLKPEIFLRAQSSADGMSYYHSTPGATQIFPSAYLLAIHNLQRLAWCHPPYLASLQAFSLLIKELKFLSVGCGAKWAWMLEAEMWGGAAALMRPIPPEAGHYRDKSAHPMDARMHPKGVRGPCCVR